MQKVMRFWKLGLLLMAAVVALSIVTFVLTEPKMAVAIVEGGGGDNVAVAFNTKDDSTSFTSRFRILRSRNETVDQQNAAIAYANCDSCQTVSNATQVVLVMNDDPETITPTNVAVAVNENCTDCETLANAYQTVLGTGGPVHFTPEGNRRIAELRKKYQQLRNSGLTIEEIQAEFDAYEAELEDILANELVPAGNSRNTSDNGNSGATPSESKPSATDESAPEGAQTSSDGQEEPATDGAAPQDGSATEAPGASESITESKSTTKTGDSPPNGKTPGDAAPDEEASTALSPAQEETPAEPSTP